MAGLGRSVTQVVTQVRAATAPDELLDALMEVIVRAPGPAARAAVVAELVQEMSAIVEWLHEHGTELDDAHADELIGMARLCRAAQQHRREMAARHFTALG